jgi:hypothetical protein
MRILTKSIMEKGKLLAETEKVNVIRNRVLRQLRYLNV